jgi:hypothetical protein
MLQELSEYRSGQAEQPGAGADQRHQAKRARTGADPRLQVVLWTLWALAVAGAAFLRWRADIVAGRPVDLLGLVIYTILSGTIGLVVLTLVEIRLEPQRFSD